MPLVNAKLLNHLYYERDLRCFVEIHLFILRCFITAPQKVEGLRVIDIYKQDGLYDVTVNWDKPNKEPDNYTIQLETFRENKILLTVPGVRITINF